MSSSLLRWIAMVSRAARPDSREVDNRAAVDALNWRHAAERLPQGLSLQWLGTAGFRLSCQGTDLLIDPYVSRAGVGDLLAMRPLRSSPARVERWIDRADAVLVGHSHFDHAVDVPYLASRPGCTVYGSRSVRHLLALHGLERRAVEVEPYGVYEIGPFEVTFVPSVHSKLLLGLAVPSDGELTCHHLDGLHAGAYRCGQVWGIHIRVAGVTFYHQGSADLVDDAVRHGDVDYFLAGIAGRGFSEAYVSRVLRALSPRVVIPQHYDDFFRPLDSEMKFSFNVGLASFVEEVRAVSRDFTVRTLDPLQVVT